MHNHTVILFLDSLSYSCGTVDIATTRLAISGRCSKCHSLSDKREWEEISVQSTMEPTWIMPASAGLSDRLFIFANLISPLRVARCADKPPSVNLVTI